jgi:hypothetical protein
MDVTVTFCVYGENTCIPEEQIEQNFARYRDELITNRDLDGCLIIAAPPYPNVRIEDTLEAIVQNLCFATLSDLKDGHAVENHYFSQVGTIHFLPEGDTIRIEGDFVTSATIPRVELVAALFGCGQRFMIFLRKLLADDADGRARIEWLAQYEQRALEVMTS